MTDQQLIFFTSIIELGSFSEAALELNISQSSISKQIMQLEDELGVKLFDRKLRRVRLTYAGEMLYDDALAALSKIQHLKKTAAQLAQAGKNQITLLAIPIISHYNFYIPLQLFESAHQECHVELVEVEEPEMYRRIKQGEYDAAITYFNPGQNIQNARFYPLIEDEMVVVCHNSHPYSELSAITPQMLDDVPVLAMQKYTCTSQLYELYFQKYRSNPHVIFRGRPGTILAAAEARRGPALLSRIHTEALKISNVSLIPFSPPLNGILGIIVRESGRNEAYVLEMIQVLKDSTLS